MTELWTYDQAGEHCNGVSASTYRSYIRLSGAPAGTQYDPATGRKLVRADLVREWHANRKGRGHRSDLETTEA